MKRSIAMIGAIASTLMAAQTTQAPQPVPPHTGPTVTSPAFDDGGRIPDKYTAAAIAKAISPPLNWSHAPSGTVSFAMVMFDLDSAVGHRTDYVLHWLIFNIPGTSAGLPENVPVQAQLPDGSIQALNRGKKPGYLAPGADAKGPYHHYSFELFALDTKLNLGPDATLTDVDNAMQGHILVDRGILIGRFRRPQAPVAP